MCPDITVIIIFLSIASLNPFDIRACVRTAESLAFAFFHAVLIPLISGHVSGQDNKHYKFWFDKS